MNDHFVVIQKEIQEIRQGKLYPSIKTFICTKDKQTGMVLPHPLTNFIKGGFDRKSISLNTEKSVAEEIKKFLDYVTECIEDEDDLFLPLEELGIKGLRLAHGASYITFLTHRAKIGEIQGNYVYRIERFLTRFYNWLSNQGIIDENVQIKEISKIINGEVVTQLISPFDNDELMTEYPKKENTEGNRLHDFGSGRLDLVNLFLRTAQLEAPDIALGIAFQIYGGLRRSEVINLLRSSIDEPIEYGSGAFTLDVDDNWKTLFPEKKIIVSEQVKNPRIQPVFKVPILIEIYENHKELLKRLDRQGKTKNKHALFCSKSTGNPISGTAYWERFTKVKEKFIKVVYENDLEDYQFLISKPWSTHIGRSIYTNMITFLLGWQATELAIARGDKRIESSKRYVEKQNVINQTIMATEKIAKATLQFEDKYNLTLEDIRRL